MERPNGAWALGGRWTGVARAALGVAGTAVRGGAPAGEGGRGAMLNFVGMALNWMCRCK